MCQAKKEDFAWRLYRGVAFSKIQLIKTWQLVADSKGARNQLVGMYSVRSGVCLVSLTTPELDTPQFKVGVLAMAGPPTTVRSVQLHPTRPDKQSNVAVGA